MLNIIYYVNTLFKYATTIFHMQLQYLICKFGAEYVNTFLNMYVIKY